MELTTKLNLKKPSLTDYVNVSDLNDNMDILDMEVGSLKDGSTSIADLQTENKTLAGAINELKNNKVSKVEDKQLSTNDYTTEEKNKLAGLNNYIHPVDHPASIIVEEIDKRFMTDSERTKLDGIEEGANKYIHPGSGTNPHGTTKSDVLLENVENYEIATKVEAEAGTSNVKYMTPLRVREALDSANSWILINRITTVATSRIDVILPYYKEYMIVGRDFAFPNTSTGSIEAIFNDDVSNIYFGSGIVGANIKVAGANTFIQIVPTMRNESQSTPSRFNFILTILNNIGGKNTNITQLISEKTEYGSVSSGSNLIYKYMNSAIINKVSILHKALEMLAGAELEVWGR